MDRKEYVRAYGRELYQFCKERHLCYKCKRVDAYTLAGRSRCAECAKAEAESSKARRAADEEFREKSRQYSKQRRDRLKAAGICRDCGFRPVKPGYSHCEYCLAYKRQRWHELHGYDFIEPGTCVRCRRNPSIEGKKLCSKCYAATLKALEIANRNHRNNKNHTWKLLNQMDFARQKKTKED